MNRNRLIGIGGLVLAGGLLWAGSGAGFDAKAYRFPNILAYMMTVIALAMLVAEGDLLRWSLVTARDARAWFFGGGESEAPGEIPDFVRLIPALMIMAAYLYLADIVGLYTMSFFAFLSIVTVYSPKRPRAKYLFKYTLIALIFTAAIYFVFSGALQLQPPPALLV